MSCSSAGYYTLLAWLPSFFQLALHLSVETSSLLTLVPYIAMSSMTPFVGKVADGLVAKGWEMTDVRKLAQVRLAGMPPGWVCRASAVPWHELSSVSNLCSLCVVSCSAAGTSLKLLLRRSPSQPCRQ